MTAPQQHHQIYISCHEQNRAASSVPRRHNRHCNFTSLLKWFLTKAHRLLYTIYELTGKSSFYFLESSLFTYWLLTVNELTKRTCNWNLNTDRPLFGGTTAVECIVSSGSEVSYCLRCWPYCSKEACKEHRSPYYGVPSTRHIDSVLVCTAVCPVPDEYSYYYCYWNHHGFSKTTSELMWLNGTQRPTHHL